MKQMKQTLAQKDKKRTKSKSYVCEICDYTTCHKGSYDRHLTTLKHKRMKQNAQTHTTREYVCENCGLCVKSRTTLWRHSKKCFKRFKLTNDDFEEKNGKKNGKKNEKIVKNEESSEMDFLKSKLLDLENKLKEKEKEKEKQTSTDKIWEALHESQNLLKQAIEQNNELIPKVGNNNNNNISINVILNEKCKNAPNLEDFVNKLQVSIEDLQYTKNHGYVKGLSNIMVKHLRDLPPNDRPIHCNKNSLQFYIKDENTWEKDDKNTKVTKSINKIQKKQVLKIKDWTDKHPNYCEDDDLYTEYQQMVRATMCVNPIENEDIEKNISNIVNINDVVNE